MMEPNPPDIASLFDPPPEARIETHISIVFLSGDLAWKLKKAVTLPYVDFGSLEKRRIACQREVALNRRTAPQLYRGLRAVYRDSHGKLGFVEHGKPVEWLVEMRRFDTSQTFDHLVGADALTPQMMESLAESVASFHVEVESAAIGGAEALAAALRVNKAAFARLDPGALPSEDFAAYDAALSAEIVKQQSVLAARQAAGRIRHCHGDLHLRNIVLIDGRPVLFDCLEFADDLATSDTLYDAAFLLMDLLDHSRRDLANRLLNRYLEVADDYEGVALLGLYLAVRAAVRSHIAGLCQESWPEARHYLALAREVLRPARPRLIAIGGLSGTGKSTVARQAAPNCGHACGAVILRSDAIRKMLHGKATLEHLPEQAYTAEASRQTYAALLERAAILLRGGATVILDAVFGQPEERADATALARDRGADFQGLWLDAPLDVLTGRIAARRDDASDATAAVVRWQSRALAPPSPQEGWIRVDASRTPEQVVKAIAALLTPAAG